MTDERTSPFEPHPDAERPAGFEAPPEFFLVWPEHSDEELALLTGVAKRIARVKREYDLKYFGGLVELPAGFEGVDEAYDRYDMGPAYAYRDRYAISVVWPDAPFRRARASAFAAVEGVGPTIARWQTQAIVGNVAAYFERLHPFVAPYAVAENAKRRRAFPEEPRQES